MYTYSCVAVGFQLSQIERVDGISSKVRTLCSELQDIMSECDITDFTPDKADEWAHGLSDVSIRFLNWYAQNIMLFKQHGYEVETSYHGSDEQPVILGKYVNDLFSIPDFGANRMNFENLEKLKKMAQEFVSLFDTLDHDIKQELLDSNMLGVWFNNHSS